MYDTTACGRKVLSRDSRGAPHTGSCLPSARRPEPARELECWRRTHPPGKANTAWRPVADDKENRMLRYERCGVNALAAVRHGGRTQPHTAVLLLSTDRIAGAGWWCSRERA